MLLSLSSTYFRKANSSKACFPTHPSFSTLLLDFLSIVAAAVDLETPLWASAATRTPLPGSHSRPPSSADRARPSQLRLRRRTTSRNAVCHPPASSWSPRMTCRPSPTAPSAALAAHSGHLPSDSVEAFRRSLDSFPATPHPAGLLPDCRLRSSDRSHL